MKERNSSIEILRIGAMLLIVAGHFLGQSGLLSAHEGLGVGLLGCGARWACNLFLLIGCWFMVDADFDWRHVVRLYLTVLTYTIPLTLVALLGGGHPSMKDVVRGFLPFTGRALWFASAYLSLMLLTPWLKRALGLPLNSLGRLVGLMTLLVSFVCTLPDEQMCYTIDCCWFVYVYLAVGWAKRMLQNQEASVFRRPWMKWTCLVGGLSIYVVLVSMRYSFSGFLSNWAMQCLSDFKTLPNFVSATLVFLFFAHWQAGSIAWINRLARPAFAVYVIHQTPAFFPYLWTKICRVSVWQDSPYWWAMAFGVVIGVYVVGGALEEIRRLLCKKWIKRP